MVEAAKVFPGGKRTLGRWVANYKKKGIKGLKPKSTRPKSHPRETPIRIKETIIELRKETNKCAFKLSDDLEKMGIKIGIMTIGKIIKMRGW